MMSRLPNWLPFAVLGALLLLLLTWPRLESAVVPEVSYSQFKQMVRAGEVERVMIRGEEVSAILRAAHAVGPQDTPTLEIKTRIPRSAIRICSRCWSSTASRSPASPAMKSDRPRSCSRCCRG
jgi:FtsH Extracellular